MGDPHQPTTNHQPPTTPRLLTSVCDELRPSIALSTRACDDRITYSTWFLSKTLLHRITTPIARCPGTHWSTVHPLPDKHGAITQRAGGGLDRRHVPDFYFRARCDNREQSSKTCRRRKRPGRGFLHKRRMEAEEQNFNQRICRMCKS